jgi:hypothetical protein
VGILKAVPRDYQAYNARRPVAHVRFSNPDEWALVVSAAARRGQTLNAYLRTIALEVSADGNQSSNTKADRALASTRTT